MILNQPPDGCSAICYEAPPQRAGRAYQIVSVAWLLKPVVLAVHEEQLGEHGGLSGMRDEARFSPLCIAPDIVSHTAIPTTSRV